MNTETRPRFVKKFLAAGLIAMLPVMLQPAVAQSLGGVEGTVFTSDAGTPLTGARVHLVQVGSKKTFSSSASDAKGAFDLSGVPPAAYEAAVEFEGGLYLVEMPVVVTAGQALNLNLSIPKLVNAAGQRPARNVSGSAGIMASPLGATLLVVGTALSIGALVDSASDDDPVSPFFF